LAEYGIAFLIDYSSQFLVALAYRNPMLTLRIDRLTQKLVVAIKNWLLQPIENAMPYFII